MDELLALPHLAALQNINVNKRGTFGDGPRFGESAASGTYLDQRNASTQQPTHAGSRLPPFIQGVQPRREVGM